MSSRQVVIPRFQIVRKGKILKVVPVNRKLLVVGSEEGVHLRLKHPRLSPRHLEIRVVEGRYLEAMNVAGEGKVLLNGEPMDRARLREGDELDLGPVMLKLTYKRTGMTVADQPVHEASLPAEDTIDEAPVRPDLDDHATVVEQHQEMEAVRARSAELDREPELEPWGTSGADDPFDPSDAPTADLPAYRPPQKTPAVAKVPKFKDTAEVPAYVPAEVPSPEPPGADTLAAADTEGPDAPDLPNFDDLVLDPVPVVLIEPPGAPIQRVSLRVGSFVIGSGRCAFRLSYPGIAAEHAEIMVMPDGALYLKHLGGTNLLTLLNGAPIQFSRWNLGDRIEVGPVALRFALEDEHGRPVDTAEGAEQEEAGSPPEEAAQKPPPAPQPVAEAPAPANEEPAAPPEPSAVETQPFPPPGVEGGMMSARLDHEPSLASHPPPAPAKPKKKRKSAAPMTDVFSAYREDTIGYQESAAKRVIGPVLVFLFLIGGAYLAGPKIGSWVTSLTSGDEETAVEAPIVVKRATGTSGLSDAGEGAKSVSAGPMSIGQKTAPKKARRVGDPGIDWDDNERMKFGGGSSYNTDHSQAKGYGQDADAMEAKKAGGGATVIAGGGAGTSAPTTEGPSGPADLSEVKGLIHRNRKMLRQCYTQLRIDNPDLAGTMWLEMSLGSDNRLRNVRVQARSTLKNEALRSCLERRLFSIQTPAPPGAPHTIVVPLEFAVSE
jgi:pSer/pThr/pTyr-binding forkhead associated (FHA) protein